MKHTQKPLTEEELQRYEQSLILWERGLKRETEELDKREAELEEREVLILKPLVFNDDGCNITPEEFVTTIKSCGPKCYEGGEHTADCARMVYLAVERLGKLGE